MANKPKGKPDGDGDEDEDPWTPDKPIPDDDGEAMAQQRSMLDRRVAHLNQEAEKAAKKPKKGKGLW